jgi:hypothetical protein
VGDAEEAYITGERRKRHLGGIMTNGDSIERSTSGASKLPGVPTAISLSDIAVSQAYRQFGFSFASHFVVPF